jgi:predicted DNA binding CopG/RHH family protein
MKLKIKNSETITIRISGEWYYEVQNRAIAKNMNINDYVKNALAKYMDYKEKNK